MFKYLRQLASESLVYGLAATMTRLITVFLVPLYTRTLTPEDYGVMSLVRNATTLLAIVGGLALDNAAHRFYWDTENIADRKATLACWTWACLVFGTLLAIVVVVFADFLALSIVGRKDAAGLLRVAAISVPIGIPGVIYMNRLRMERRPWAVTTYALVTSLVTILLTAVFVLVLHRGIQGVFLAQFMVALITTLLLAARLKEWTHPRHFEWKRMSRMVRYALPMLPGAVSFWIIDVIDRYFLRLYTTTSQVGLYEIGYSIAAIVALGTFAFQQAWIPFALSIQDVGNARHIYAKTLLAYTWVGSLACAGASVFASEALHLLTTKDYYGANTVVISLAFSYFLMGLGYIATLGIVVKKQTISVSVAVVAAAVLNIALNFWLVPRYGMNGAALATVFSYLVVPVYLFYRSQQVYPIPYRFGQAILLLLFAIIVSQIGSSWSFDNMWLTILAKLSLLSLFLPLLLVTRIVTFSQISALGHRAFIWRLAQVKPDAE